MNKIFKVIFSKAKGCYVVTSEIAKTHAKSTSKTTAKILTALILTAMAGMGSSYAADNVTYDDAYPGNTRITLTTGGVVVDNVANGDMAKGSKQAVNGGQLYDVNQKVIAFDGKLATVQTNISKVQGNVANLTTTVVNMKDTVDTVNDTLNSGITMTANGKTIKNINPSDMSFNYKAGKNISLTADTNGSLVITAKADGKVAAGDTNLVSGDAVNTAIKTETTARTAAESAINNKIGTMAADGHYAKVANSISANITALDTQAKKNADAISAETTARTKAIAQEVTDRNAAIKVETDARTKAETAIKTSIGSMAADGSYAKKANSLSANITALDTQAKANADAIAQEITNRGTAITNAIDKEVNDRNNAITAAKTELQGQLTTLSGNAVQYTDATKASIALGGAKGTKITNVMAGDISKADSTDAVNGGQLFTTNKNLATEISDRKAAIAQEVKDRDAAIKVETDARKESEAAINNAITNIKNMTTITDAGKTQIKELSKEAVKVAQGENITITTAEDEAGNKTYTVKATMGTVAKGQTGLVSGDAVNTAIEAEKTARTKAVNTINNTIGTIAADGNYIQKAGTISANLSALDVGLHGLQTTYNTRAAKYDGDDNVLMTLAGKGGTRITNLKEGAVTTTSTDAINGSQLANTESKINGIRDSIDTNTTNITKLTETMNANQTTISSTSEMVNTIANNRVNTNLSNLTVQGQNKLKNLVQEEIANYMKTQGQTEETTATVKATPAKVQAANIMTAGSGTPVTYDDAYEGNTRITLTTGGAVVDNVSDGEIAKGSKQAVNGGQLFTMQQTFAQYDGRIATIQGNIAKNQGNIATNTTKLITLGDKVSDITDAMNTGINVTVDGHTTTTITKDNPQLEFTSGEYITLANKNGKISVSVNPNGTAAPGNKGLMTGDAVYQAIKDIPTNTTLNGSCHGRRWQSYHSRKHRR